MKYQLLYYFWTATRVERNRPIQ